MVSYRLSDDDSLSLCQVAISYLNSKASVENGLFMNNGVAQRTIRDLIGKSKTDQQEAIRHEKNAHVIVGVLLHCLQNMQFSIFHEVDDDVLDTELTEDYDRNKSKCVSWLVRMSPNRIDILRSLFGLMLKMLSLNKSRPFNCITTGEALVEIIAPFLCPNGRISLSIRHKDAVLRTRPVIMFLVENYFDIFNTTLKSVLSRSASEKALFEKLPIHQDAMETLNMRRREKERQRMLQKQAEDREQERKMQQQQQQANSEQIKSSVGITTLRVRGLHNQAQGTGGLQQSWEWRVLEALVVSRVRGIGHQAHTMPFPTMPNASRDDNGKSRMMKSRDNGNDEQDEYDLNSSTSSMPTQVMKRSRSGDRDATPAAVATKPARPVQPMKAATRAPTSSNSTQRRATVSEMRELKQRITTWEARFASTHGGRGPKSSADKKPMAEVYERYKMLKRNIRNQAATDISKIVRCFLVKRRVRRAKEARPAMDVSSSMELMRKRQPQKRVIGVTTTAPGITNAHKASDGEEEVTDLHGSAMATSQEQNSKEDSKDFSQSTSISETSMLQSIQRSSSRLDVTMVMHQDKSGASSSSDMRDAMGIGDKVMSSLSLDTGLNVNQVENIKDALKSKLHEGSGEVKAVDDNIDVNKDNDKDNKDNGSSEVRYFELVNQKRNLKKALKQFDEDFETKNGRPPRKADKEVMRPQYQRYHDLKGEIDALKVQIVLKTGQAPIDRDGNEMDTSPRASTATTTGSNLMFAGAEAETTASASDGGNSPPVEAKKAGRVLRKRGDEVMSASSNSFFNDTADGNFNNKADLAKRPIPVVSTSLDFDATTSSSVKTGSITNPPVGSSESTMAAMSMPELNEEKKLLHNYLKAFEKNFQKENDRPVTKQEDIYPVAEEYKKYKYLKALIQQRKATKDNA